MRRLSWTLVLLLSVVGRPSGVLADDGFGPQIDPEVLRVLPARLTPVQADNPPPATPSQPAAPAVEPVAPADLVPAAPSPDTAPPAGTLTSQSDPTAPLTLLECIEYALLHNPSLGEARTGIERALGQHREAGAALLPHLTFSYVEIWQQQTKVGFPDGLGGVVENTITPGNMRSFTLQSDWTIYAGGALRANLAIARLSRGLANEQVLIAVNSIIANTVAAYLQLLQAGELKQVADRTVELAREQVRVAQINFEAGAVPRVNVLRAEAALQGALQHQLMAGNGIDLAAAGLNAVMGRSQLQPVTVTPLPRQLAEAPDLISSLQLAVVQRPELRAGQGAIEINKRAVDAARGGYLPALGFQGSISRSDGVGAFGSSDNFQFLLNARFNLWDWQATSGRVKQSQADLQAARRRLESTMQQIELAIRQAVLNIAAARQRVAVAQAEVAAAQQALAIEELRYTAGAGTYLELLDARRAVTDAESNLVNSYYDNARAEADWLAATGGYVAADGQVQLPQGQTMPLPAEHLSQGVEHDQLLARYGVEPRPAPTDEPVATVTSAPAGNGE